MSASAELRQAADRLLAEQRPNEALAKLLNTLAAAIDRNPDSFPVTLGIARRVNAWEAK